MKVFSSLRTTYRAVADAIDPEHISNDIRHSVESVRTCYQELQELIELRNEYLHLLESQPHSLERVNTIIEKAHMILRDASRIVEKYRLELRAGTKSIQSQISWARRDSQQYKALAPTLSRHNLTILAEISFLKDLAVSPTQIESKKVKESTGSGDKNLFDNMELLKDVMGDGTGFRDRHPASRPMLRPPAIKLSASTSMPNLLIHQEYCDLPEVVMPNMIHHRRPIGSSQASKPMLSSRDGDQCSRRVVLNPADHSGLSLLFDNKMDLNFNYLPELESQYSPGQSDDSMHNSSVPSLSLTHSAGEMQDSTPWTKYSHSSRPSEWSISSIGTPDEKYRELSVDWPHLFSLPPKQQPTNTTALISPSPAPLPSEVLLVTKHTSPSIQPSDRYANMTKPSAQESKRYHPWRPYANEHVFELQGPETALEAPSFTKPTTLL